MANLTNLMLIFNLLEKLVLLVLVGLSFYSVAVMFDRRRVFRRLAPLPASEQWLTWIRVGDWQNLRQAAGSAGMYGEVIQALAQLQPGVNGEVVDATVRTITMQRRLELERGLNLLATLGANAPFVGLFGTVLGIIEAFAVLSSTTGVAGNIMGAIAQALIATAAGLFVAMPAVVAYNLFSYRIRQALATCEVLRTAFLAHRQEAH